MSSIAKPAVVGASRTIWRSMSKGKVVEGVFAINKPTGISSAQVLRDCQDVFHNSQLFAPYLAQVKHNLARDNPNQRKRRKNQDPKVKIGHGGTLDPLATGVLIAGIGIGTKSLQDFLKCTKTYETVLLFGASTDTYDRVGKVLRKAPYEHITRELVEEKMEAFKGTFLQLPPIFSALKMDGKPLYEYAREGKPIPRKIERRPVEVVELELLEWMEGGTHEHKAPTEEGSEAEINVAKQVWAQAGFEDAADADLVSRAEKEAEAQKESESRKRKLSEDHDELVQEKQAKYVKTDPLKYSMSGGLSDAKPESEPTPSIEIKTDATPATTTITPMPSSPISKGPPAARIRMTVTSGFYVRSFCHDLGTAVGSAGLMAELIRSRQGDFSFEAGNVLEYSDLKRGEEVWGPQVNRMTDEWWAKKAAPATSNAPEKAQSSESAAKAEIPKQASATTEQPAKPEQTTNAEAATSEESKDAAVEPIRVEEPIGEKSKAAEPVREEPTSGENKEGVASTESAETTNAATEQAKKD